MDIQVTHPESEEDNNSKLKLSGLGARVSNWWKWLVEGFRKIGPDTSVRQTVPHERFTHTAIMHRLNHPDK